MRSSTRLCALLSALAALLAIPGTAAASPQPAWSLQGLSAPTGFTPGDESGLARYQVFLTNTGAKASDPDVPVTIVNTLPAGLGVKEVELFATRQPDLDLNAAANACEEATVADITTVTCTLDEGLEEFLSDNPTSPDYLKEPARLAPLEQALLTIKVTAPETSTVVALTNKVEVEGGGASPVLTETHNEIDPACKAEPNCAQAGFQDFQAKLTDEEGNAVTGAASHPFQFTTTFAVNMNPAPPSSSLPFVPAGGDLKEIEVALPPGLIANPQATERCTAQQFTTTRTESAVQGNLVYPNDCPDSSAVGMALIEQFEGRGQLRVQAPIYNLVPPPGMPAQLGFQPTHGLPVYIDTAVEQGPEGTAVRAYVHNITESKRVTASLVTLWGTPADESHDELRGLCGYAGGSCPANLPTVRPSFRLPTSCEGPLRIAMRFDTWLRPGIFAAAGVNDPPPVGCEHPDFSPTIESKATTNVADAPSGLHFNLHLPQAANEDPEGLAEADLRDASVTLAPGLVVNPAAADGRTACGPAQIGLQSAVGATPIVFDQAPAACPAAAKIGKVEVDTPLLDHPLRGAVYLAAQQQNPFNSLLAIYIALEDPRYGITIKLAGKVTPDPDSGRLTTTFTDNPQVPFEDLRFTFFEGPRAPLRTPAFCATHTTNTELTPWSAPAGSPAFPSGSFATTNPAAGQGSCPTSASQLPHDPGFEAGTEAPLAGAFSPLTINLRRGDGTQEFAQVTLNPPPGLLARLAGIPYCSDAALAAAASGSGRAEQASSSCPPASQVGSVTVGAGAGPAPYYASGRAYLSGPYKGAPLSLAIITPAVAGPFDLGTVVVRTALHVDPATARISAVSDPIPHILQGIPLDVRSVSVRLDRPGWGLNPTSCDPLSFSGALRSTLGQSAGLENRFQVGECARLGFKPRLKLRLKGKTRRGAYQGVRAVLRPRAGDANISRTVVRFPRSAFVAQEHIRTVCTRVQWAAEACPKGSVYGTALAYSPLLDYPLRGKVYLRSSDNELPDAVADLRGPAHQPVRVEVAIRNDSVKGALRNTVLAAPDAPVSYFRLQLFGAKRGLIVNSRHLCKGKRQRAAVRLGAHNGRQRTLRPLVGNGCKKKKAKKRAR